MGIKSVPSEGYKVNFAFGVGNAKHYIAVTVARGSCPVKPVPTKCAPAKVALLNKTTFLSSPQRRPCLVPIVLYWYCHLLELSEDEPVGQGT